MDTFSALLAICAGNSPGMREFSYLGSIGRFVMGPCFSTIQPYHDDVIKWKHFPRYWPFVRGIHRSPVNSPHKGQWRGALMFSLICAGINGWVNTREAGDLRRYRGHYDVTVMYITAYYHLMWFRTRVSPCNYKVLYITDISIAIRWI